MKNKVFLSVIIPNYNESENLRRGVLKEVSDYLSTQDYEWEVILSDDGSTDDSLKIINEYVSTNPKFKLKLNKHAGKPFALKSAIDMANGEFLLLTDMDQSTPIRELEKLLDWKNSHNIIIGSRGRGRDSSWYRQIISLGFWFFRRSIVLPDITDTQCGFKLIRTSIARKIFKKMQIFTRSENSTGWKVTAYDVEMLFIGKKMGEKIKEVRVRWRDEDTSKGKDRNFVKESLEMLQEIFRVRYNDLLGKYD